MQVNAKEEQLGKWSVQLADWVKEMGIPRLEPSPWCGRNELGFSRRVCGLIDAVVWAKLGIGAKNKSFSEKREALLHVYVDVSQNPGRRPFTNQHGTTGTMTTSSLFYSFGRGDFVLPFEMLLWHGHSRTLVVPKDVKSSQIKTLAGEGMSLPCLGTIIWAGLLARFGDS